MKYVIALMLFVTLVCPSQAEEGKIRVLLTFGGHGFEEQPFFAVFDAMPDVEYTKAPMPQSLDLLKPGLEKQYDVIVMYDMVQGISPEQQKAFVELLNTGIGVFSLHHNMGANQDWPEFRKIIGGKFPTKPSEIDGKQYAPSLWSHDEDMKIAVVDKQHPITRGIEDFEIHDETYKNYYTEPGVKILLTTDHPKNNPEIGWVKEYGKSRVFYFMLGHDAKAYANTNFAKIIRQGIQWTAGRKSGK